MGTISTQLIILILAGRAGSTLLAKKGRERCSEVSTVDSVFMQTSTSYIMLIRIYFCKAAKQQFHELLALYKADLHQM